MPLFPTSVVRVTCEAAHTSKARCI
jgi:hypothetical protein